METNRTADVRPLSLDLSLRLIRTSTILLLLLVIVFVLCSSVGAITVHPLDVLKVLLNHVPGAIWQFDVPEADIIWQFRIPRVLLGVLVGISLSTAGVVLQGLLQNPLADPYIIGVSSGAAAGAGIAVLLELSYFALGFGIPLLAFVSALLAVSAVYFLSQRGGKVSMLSFLLAGVVVGSFMWAALTLILTIAPNQNLETIVFWTMGSLAGTDPGPWTRVLLLLPFTAAGYIILNAFTRDLNVFALGEEAARYLGLDVEFLKRAVILVATLITAAAVSVSGTIGFVGLIVPHIARRLVGPEHRILLPCSALLGAILMISADALARTLMRPGEIPVGVITALLGAPFFLYLLKKKSSAD